MQYQEREKEQYPVCNISIVSVIIILTLFFTDDTHSINETVSLMINTNVNHTFTLTFSPITFAPEIKYKINLPIRFHPMNHI